MSECDRIARALREEDYKQIASVPCPALRLRGYAAFCKEHAHEAGRGPTGHVLGVEKKLYEDTLNEG